MAGFGLCARTQATFFAIVTMLKNVKIEQRKTAMFGALDIGPCVESQHEQCRVSYRKEATQTELDSLIAASGHFNACENYERKDVYLGSISTILGVLTAATVASSFQIDVLPPDLQQKAKLLFALAALIAAAIAACIKFLNPSERANEHGKAGKQYQALADDVRHFKNIQMLHAPIEKVLEKVPSDLEVFRRRRQEIHSGAPIIPAAAWRKAISPPGAQHHQRPRDIQARRIASLMHELRYSRAGQNGSEPADGWGSTRAVCQWWL